VDCHSHGGEAGNWICALDRIGCNTWFSGKTAILLKVFLIMFYNTLYYRFKQYFLAIAVLLVCGIFKQGFPQSATIDSIQKVLQGELSNEARIQNLHELHKLIYQNEPEKSLQIAKEATRLSLSENNQKSLIKSYQA